MASQTVEQVEQTARTVVGPDEPLSGGSWAEAEAAYWAMLGQKLKDAGVDANGAEMATLIHEVEISDRVRSLLKSA
ncbi:MAG: hypothetical protein JO027_06000 [Solirubrobacterales bacterium]|nr:hypothetical protein [Solirubrobacterales bacterium]